MSEVTVPLLSIVNLVSGFACPTRRHLHRVYGPARMPLLTANWAVLDVHLYNSSWSAADYGGLWAGLRASPHPYEQPLVVLRNMRGVACK